VNGITCSSMEMGTLNEDDDDCVLGGVVVRTSLGVSCVAETCSGVSKHHPGGLQRCHWMWSLTYSGVRKHYPGGLLKVPLGVEFSILRCEQALPRRTQAVFKGAI